MSPSDTAADLVKQLPTLATSLRKYDEQNFQLQLRYDNLEDEIARVRRSIKHKQAQQVRFVEHLTYKDLEKGSLKRQRDQDEPETRSSRPRLADRISQPQNHDFKASASEVSIRTKRRGRVFSSGEVDEDANL